MTRALEAIVVGLALAASAACAGGAQTQGRSPGYLVIDALLGASGATPTKFANTLDSDVVTNVKQTVNGQQVSVPTVYEDPGEVQIHLNLKDLGTSANPTAPTAANQITITRYHVEYMRSDNPNPTQGVDVPYAFDGAVTATITGSSPVTIGFILVRVQAKQEAPLVSLIGDGGQGAISTIAKVTFYGQDQAGNQVSVSGTISVNFADWADPTSSS
ncbi:MAG: hypothetical protein KGN76_13090 [Acidobacteriota bacterium]|nr:hypothetical protein [Acidobacteriota bacterium]